MKILSEYNIFIKTISIIPSQKWKYKIILWFYIDLNFDSINIFFNFSEQKNNRLTEESHANKNIQLYIKLWE